MDLVVRPEEHVQAVLRAQSDEVDGVAWDLAWAALDSVKAAIRASGVECDEGPLLEAVGDWVQTLAQDWARQWDDGFTEYSA